MFDEPEEDSPDEATDVGMARAFWQGLPDKVVDQWTQAETYAKAKYSTTTKEKVKKHAASSFCT